MHVVKHQPKCPVLEVHDNPISNVEEKAYLDDYVSVDGKNMKNIQVRTHKGMGLVCLILNIIQNVSFSNHTVECNSFLLSGIIIKLKATLIRPAEPAG